MKNKVKMIVDIAMTISFIILMGYYVTDSAVHEILGTITFILFILHHILNINGINLYLRASIVLEEYFTSFLIYYYF